MILHQTWVAAVVNVRATSGGQEQIHHVTKFNLTINLSSEPVTGADVTQPQSRQPVHVRIFTSHDSAYSSKADAINGLLECSGSTSDLTLRSLKAWVDAGTGPVNGWSS